MSNGLTTLCVILLAIALLLTCINVIEVNARVKELEQRIEQMDGKETANEKD